MKFKSLLLSIIFFAAFNTDAYCQYLSFDNLTYLVNKDIEFINDYLSNKGWSYDSSENPSRTTGLTVVTWNYNKNGKTCIFKLQHFPETDLYNKTSVGYMTNSKDNYELIKERIKFHNMKLETTYTESQNLYFIYYGQDYKIRVILPENKFASGVFYGFNVTKK